VIIVPVTGRKKNTLPIEKSEERRVLGNELRVMSEEGKKIEKGKQRGEKSDLLLPILF